MRMQIDDAQGASMVLAEGADITQQGTHPSAQLLQSFLMAHAGGAAATMSSEMAQVREGGRERWDRGRKEGGRERERKREREGRGEREG